MASATPFLSTLAHMHSRASSAPSPLLARMITSPLDLPTLRNEPGTLEAVREMRAYAENLESAMSAS